MLIAQGHREVGWVADNHIRLGHLLHHPLLGHGALHLANPAFDLRVAFRLFIFFLNFLLKGAVRPS